jgi:hypothetical protein
MIFELMLQHIAILKWGEVTLEIAARQILTVIHWQGGKGSRLGSYVLTGSKPIFLSVQPYGVRRHVGISTI